MNLQIKPFDALTPQELHAVARLRQEVFYLEQKVTCADLDAADLRCVFLWAESDGQTVGCLRIIPPQVMYDEASIGRVAVSASHRHKGIARQMMQAALAYIAERWHTPVKISSQEYILPFYESLGFKTVSERYLEAGIPHRKMIYQ